MRPKQDKFINCTPENSAINTNKTNSQIARSKMHQQIIRTTRKSHERDEISKEEELIWQGTGTGTELNTHLTVLE